MARTPCSQCRGPIPGQGMRSHMLQLRVHVPQLRPGASKLPKKKKKKKRKKKKERERKQKKKNRKKQNRNNNNNKLCL